MMLYLILMVWVMALAIIYLPKRNHLLGDVLICYKPANRQLKRFIFCITFAFFCLLTAFRSLDVGNDTRNYAQYFELVAKEGVTDELTFEKGYQFYCLLLSKISNNPIILFSVTAILCYTYFVVLILKRSKDIFFSLCMFFAFFLSFYMNVLRQGLAMIFTTKAFYELKDKHIIRAVLFILLASTIHISALLFLGLLFYRIIPTKPKIVIPLLGVIVLGSISGVFVSILQRLIPKYSGYFNGEAVGSGYMALAYYLILYLFIYFYTYFAYRKKKNKLVLSTATILLLLIGFGFTINMISRLSNYFLIIMLVEFPNVLRSRKINFSKSLRISFCVIINLFFIVSMILRPGWNRIVPYNFITF